MKKIAIISSIHLYIINIIKKIRIEFGLSFKDIADILEIDSINNPLGAIEGKSSTARYTDVQLNKLARSFTKICVWEGIDKVYTLNDFYPPVDFEEKMVEKVIVKIDPTELGQTGTLYLLLVEESDAFFDDWHTSKEIAQYCGSKAEKNWEAKDFTAIIDQAVKKGILIRKSEKEALFKRP